MLYIVYADSANYCGYGQHFVVEASSEDEASELVVESAEDYFREQDEGQLDDEGHDLDGMVFANIVSVEELNEDHECWSFYNDPSQSEFYIRVNL